MTEQAPARFNESRPIESQESGEAPTQTTVYKAYWGVLSETLLTWMIAVAAARDSKWFSVRVYSGLFSFSSKRYYLGLGKCFAYGDVDYEEFDDACSLTKAARAFQILATLVISAVLPMVLLAAVSQAPQTGKFGLYVGLMLAVFSAFELAAFSLAASYSSKVRGSYDDDSNDYFSLGVTFYLAVTAWLLGTAGSIVSLVLRKRATTDQHGPLADLKTAAVCVDLIDLLREPNNPSPGTQGTQGTQGANGTQATV